MNQLHITDPDLLAKLRTTGEAEVVDATGRIVGQVAFKPMTYPEVGLTDEEIKRRRTDPNAKRYTPEEVMARLREIDRCSG